MQNDRAKQFMPFDALKGFKEEINKRNKIVVEKRELSEDDYKELQRKICLIKEGMIVTITYFDNKELIIQDYLRIFFTRTNTMFDYDGLPETIPKEEWVREKYHKFTNMLYFLENQIILKFQNFLLHLKKKAIIMLKMKMGTIM